MSSTSARADELFAKLAHAMRTQLRRNAERGIEIEELRDPGDVQQAYYFAVSYARSRVPLVDVSLFRAALADSRRTPVESRWFAIKADLSR